MDLGKSRKFGFSGGGVFCNFGFGLREKLGNLDFPERGGVFRNFGFGLRKKVGNLDFPGGGYSATSDLDLGKNLEIWIFQRGGGYSATSDLDLGKNLEIWIFQRGGYSATSDLDFISTYHTKKL